MQQILEEKTCRTAIPLTVGMSGLHRRRIAGPNVVPYSTKNASPSSSILPQMFFLKSQSVVLQQNFPQKPLRALLSPLSEHCRVHKSSILCYASLDPSSTTSLQNCTKEGRENERKRKVESKSKL